MSKLIAAALKLRTFSLGRSIFIVLLAFCILNQALYGLMFVYLYSNCGLSGLVVMLFNLSIWILPPVCLACWGISRLLREATFRTKKTIAITLAVIIATACYAVYAYSIYPIPPREQFCF